MSKVTITHNVFVIALLIEWAATVDCRWPGQSDTNSKHAIRPTFVAAALISIKTHRCGCCQVLLFGGAISMEMKQVSDNCFAVLNEKNRVCDANSGLINQGGGVVIDTQSDLPHARQMIEMFGKVWSAMPQRVINTHEDADHVWGNQLFEGAEIIAHRSVPERMKKVAEPKETQKLLHGVGHFLTRVLLKATHPGLAAAGKQLLEDYNFDGIELVLPTTLFDTRYELNLDGTEVHLIYVGPCHQVGDTIIHVPKERVVFAGDVLFRQCTPMGWTGSYEKWFQCLDLLVQLDPEVIVPGHGALCGIEGA